MSKDIASNERRTEVEKTDEEKQAEFEATRWPDKQVWPPLPTDGVGDSP